MVSRTVCTANYCLTNFGHSVQWDSRTFIINVIIYYIVVSQGQVVACELVMSEFYLIIFFPLLPGHVCKNHFAKVYIAE